VVVEEFIRELAVINCCPQELSPSLCHGRVNGHLGIQSVSATNRSGKLKQRNGLQSPVGILKVPTSKSSIFSIFDFSSLPSE
jgi:hypothetical protein